MKEKTLHYIWKNRLFDGLTLDGDPSKCWTWGSIT